MGRVLQITSNDHRRLVIDQGDEPDPLYWRAVLESPGLTATADLDTDPILFNQYLLRDYFSELAANWRGWTGIRTWRTPALAFAATHDGLGHVVLTAELARDLYDNWTAVVPLELDAGSLDRVARDVSSFIAGLEFGANLRGTHAEPPIDPGD